MKTTTLTLLAALLAAFSAQAQPLQAVNLRSTAGFAVLAGSLVSNVPTSSVTGNVGLSPATGGNITGFGPGEVVGTIYTVDASGPAGSVPAASMLTTAKGDLTLAYNDAAGRAPVPSGAFLNPGSGGNIGGLTLVAGLYKFTSSASVVGSNLTLTGSATDVWIFQIASGLTVGNGVQVVLAGGARAANVFWQVGTSAMLGTTSVFKGTILADQSISLNTGASLEGRALASVAAVTLASNVITLPSGATAVSSAANRAPRFEFFPGNGSRSIGFILPTSGKASLTLFNTYGQELGVLFNGYVQAGKRHDINFSHMRVSKGLYFAKLKSGREIRVGRVLLAL
jgi:hypothetical protein